MSNHDRFNQNMYGNDHTEWKKENTLHKNAITDYGPFPFVTNIEKATQNNKNFRVSLWTGEFFQLTLMCINPGEDVGLEVHPELDQFLRIEQGQGIVMMGDSKDSLTFYGRVFKDCAIIIPGGTWHNLINTGCTPLKLYSIYAPPEHPYGTVQATKKDALADEHHHE